MWAHKQQQISHKMNYRHPWQLKKSKFWDPFWSYQLNSTANPIYLKIGPNWPNRQCCLAGSSKTAPKILTFSIAMGANNSSYVKSIATYTPTFFGCTYYFRLSHGALVALIRECSHAACEHSYQPIYTQNMGFFTQ